MDLKMRYTGTVAVPVLELTGRLDAYAVPGVSQWIEQGAGNVPAQLVVDLTGVPFLDSTALATLLHGMKHCRRNNGDLYLCGIQQAVRIIFDLTRLDRVFKIYPTQEEAMHAFAN